MHSAEFNTTFTLELIQNYQSQILDKMSSACLTTPSISIRLFTNTEAIWPVLKKSVF